MGVQDLGAGQSQENARARGALVPYDRHEGYAFLSDGDRPWNVTSVREAKQRCGTWHECKGFTCLISSEISPSVLVRYSVTPRLDRSKTMTAYVKAYTEDAF